MIGYYVHHQGRGHLHRALTLARHLAQGDDPEPVTVLSSLAPPPGCTLPWVRLPPDTDDETPRDPTAGGVLHWAPLHHPGLRARTAAISAWLEQARPRTLVADVSQEVALLARLHGVPVVSVVLPGHRDDAPHASGLRASSAVCSFWPPEATAMLTGVPDDVAARLRPLGALSRYAPAERPATRPPGPPRLSVVGGGGGAAWGETEVAALVSACPDWQVRVAGPGGTWVEDPWPLLVDADVVVVQSGQNAVAEVAAAGAPAVVVPGARPFDEQAHTAAQLDAGPWPAVALGRLAHDDWPGLLARVAGLDGSTWRGWCDGRAAGRFADLVRDVA